MRLAPHLERFRASLGSAADGLTADELAQFYVNVRVAARGLAWLARQHRRAQDPNAGAASLDRLAALARLEGIERDLTAYRGQSSGARSREVVA